MQITNVSYREFMCFRDASLTLNLPGLSILEGRVLGTPGFDSNGSGKSAIFDGLSWCLYDRCLRERYTGADVCRLGGKGQTSVTATLLDGDDTWVISRFREGNKNAGVTVTRNGDPVTRSTIVATNELIAHIVGMDFVTFCSSVAFGTREDVRGFFTATDKDRKAVLEQLLGFGFLSDAITAAERRRKVLVADVQEHQAHVVDTTNTLAFLRGQAAAYTADGWLERAQATLAEAQAQVPPAEAEHKKVAAAYETARKANALAQREYTGLWNTYHSAVEAVEVTRRELSGRLVEARRAASTADTMRASRQAEAASLLKKSGGVCTMCEQVVDPEHVKRLAAERRAKADQFAKERDRHNADVARLQKEHDLLVIPDPPLSAAKERTAAAESAAQYAMRDAANRLDAAKKTVADAQAEIERVTAAAATAQQRVQDLEMELQAQQAEQAHRMRGVSDLDFWVEGFGQRGLRSLLLEQQLPEINRTATLFAQTLIGNGSVIALSAVRELKSRAGATKEEMTVEAVIPGRTRTYQGASKGQRRRLDLCMLLAFHAVVANRLGVKINQLFIDELFDGLDRTGTARVIELLAGLSSGCPIILVTHNPQLKGVGHRAITVVHDGDAAVIQVQQDPVAAVCRPKAPPTLAPAPPPASSATSRPVRRVRRLGA